MNFKIGDLSPKGFYFDGHERADVFAYRKKFLIDMEAHQTRMNIYEGDNMETVISPDLPDQTRPLVMVVHDE